ncbi:hypothetical protein T492DRAFT_1090774 [Pavlovales sp. CCMP2436]|nr:hypothetical protein T492DRAFT_1090774 [Pavlovales sp. CCMP2436]
MAAAGSRHGAIFWEEEKANVGLKLMQGMGWEHGTGLGSNGHGVTTSIRVRQKKDNAGIGATLGTRDDAWKATQDIYDSILTRLNDKDAVTAVETEDKTQTTTPTVKQTMARHALYRKFRAAKNASGYSATDMACIFGKRADEDVLKPEHKDSAVDSGHQTTTSTVCMRTYFAGRMRAATDGGGVGAGSGFTEDMQTAFATEMTQRAEARGGRQGLGFSGGGRAESGREAERTYASQANAAVAPPAPPREPAAAPTAVAEPAAKRARTEEGKPEKLNWKRALRKVMDGSGADGLKLKACHGKLVEHFGGALSLEEVKEQLERKAAKAGFVVDGKRIRPGGPEL